MNQSLSLSELCSLIEDAVSTRLPDTYWVRAEVASLSEKGGHLYMDLVEKGRRGMFVARQRATCWNGVQQMLCAYFAQETGTELRVGIQVLLEVAVRFHSIYGISLEVRNIDPQYTLGDLARQRQQTILRLQEDGIFDMQRMLSLPTLVRRLAVVSAADAAGYGDFVNQLAAAPYRFSSTLFPAAMQGERAEGALIAALDAIAARESEFDAVIVIRGGGAATDLACFDNYNLCAHCAQFPLPVITGIGHTRDVSVLDMVAHTALKTPTAVAAFLVDRMDEQNARIDSLCQRLRQTAARQVLLRQHRVDRLEQRLQFAVHQMIAGQKMRIDRLESHMELVNPERIYRMGYSLTRHNGKIVRTTDGVQTGDTLVTELLDGRIETVVTTLNRRTDAAD